MSEHPEFSICPKCKRKYFWNDLRLLTEWEKTWLHFEEYGDVETVKVCEDCVEKERDAYFESQEY